MNTSPLVSICIPSYKRTNLLKRLLDSIIIQTFRDYEVIVSDDSPDFQVQEVCKLYNLNIPIIYFKNDVAMGTPANWNACIARASGNWIKLMHDDDWFTDENSLGEFVVHAAKNKFIISAYNNVFEEDKSSKAELMPAAWAKKIINNPMILLSRNVIGPPSVTMLHKSIVDQYDVRMKWRVDIDFYIRILKKEKNFTYINKNIVNVGISNSQVTNYCIGKPEIELPEGFLLLKKYGLRSLLSLRVYDAWWRLIRNVGVRNSDQLKAHTQNDIWPVAIENMVQHQSLLPTIILNNGYFSKPLMALSYILNLRHLNATNP